MLEMARAQIIDVAKGAGGRKCWEGITEGDQEGMTLGMSGGHCRGGEGGSQGGSAAYLWGRPLPLFWSKF